MSLEKPLLIWYTSPEHCKLRSRQSFPLKQPRDALAGGMRMVALAVEGTLAAYPCSVMCTLRLQRGIAVSIEDNKRVVANFVQVCSEPTRPRGRRRDTPP